MHSHYYTISVHVLQFSSTAKATSVIVHITQVFRNWYHNTFLYIVSRFPPSLNCVCVPNICCEITCPLFWKTVVPWQPSVEILTETSSRKTRFGVTVKEGHGTGLGCFFCFVFLSSSALPAPYSTLNPSLPWCHLKMTNKSAKFETLKPFCLLFHTGM